MVVCLSQAVHNGFESYYSTVYGQKFTALTYNVKPQKWKKISKLIKDAQTEMKELQPHIEKAEAAGNLTEYYHKRVARKMQLTDQIERLTLGTK